MKLINKVLEGHKKLSAEDIVEYECPHHYGFERLDIYECHKMSCEECWNRGVEEDENNR